MSSNLEAAITLKASVDQFAAGINSAVTSFTGAMSRIASTAEQTGSATDEALKKIGIRRHAEIEAEIRSVEDAYRQLAESGELSGRELAQASLRMQERVRELHEETNGWMTSLGKMKGELVAAGAALYGIGRTLQAAAGESMRFGRAMAEVSTLLDDTSDLDTMSEAVRQLTREFGGDATANAKALYDVISAGAADSTAAIATLTAANKLAVGGVTEVKVAADGLTSAMNAYGAAAGSATDVSDAFFVAVRAGKTTVAELASSIGQVAPIASEAGVALEELLAGVATLTAGGVKTSEAMTQIRGALTSIIKPSSDAVKLAEELGLQFDAQALKAKGLAGFLADVKTATGGNIETMGRLFGSVEGLNAVLTLTGRGAEKFGETMEKMGGKAGETEKAVAKMMDTPAQRVELFQAAMRDLGLSLGDAVSAFTPLLTAVTSLVNQVNELPGPVKTVAVGLGAAAIAAGPLMVALGSLVRAYGILRVAVAASTAEHVANTAAMGANATAATAAAGTLATIGKVLRALPWLAVAAAAGTLIARLIELREQSRKLKEAEADAEAGAEKLSEAYAKLSVRTGVAVSNSREFAEAIQAGKLVFDEAKGSWEAAAPALDEVSKSARAFAEELVKADAAKLIAQFDEIINKGGAVESALKKIAEGLEFGSPDRVAAFARALADLAATGRIGAVELESAWRSALSALNGVQLNVFALNLKAAFDDGKISGQEFARVNDEVLSASFKRLGINAAAALGRISPAAADAIAAVDGIVDALDGAQVASQRAALVIEQALTKAFSVADSLPALDALEARLKRLAAEGKLSAEGVARLGAEVQKARARIEQATPGVTGVTKALARNAAEAEAAAKKIAALRGEYERLIAAGDVQGAAAVAQRMIELRQEAEQAAAQLKELGDGGKEAADGLKQAGEGGKKAAEGGNEAAEATARLGSTMNDTASVAAWYAKVIAKLKADIAAYSDAALAAVEAAAATSRSFHEVAGKISGLAGSARELMAADSLGGAERTFRAAADEASKLRAELELAQDWNSLWGAGLAFYGLRKYIASLYKMRAALAQAKADLAELDVEVERFNVTLAEGSTHLRAQERELLRLVARAQELGSQQLTGLRAALDDVRRKMRDVADSARDTLASVRDDLDQIEGRYVEIERRRMESRRADIDAQLAEARASGDQEAVRMLAEARRTLERLERARVDEARAREREARERQREERTGGGDGPGRERGSVGRGTTMVHNTTPIHIHGITDPVKLAPIIERELQRLGKLRN